MFSFSTRENIYVQLVILHFLNKINSTYIPQHKRERKAGGAKKSCHTQKQSLSESQTELCQRGLGSRPTTSGVWETRDECLQAPGMISAILARRGGPGVAPRGDRWSLLLALVRPHYRENPVNTPPPRPPRAWGNGGQTRASPLPTPKRALSLVTRLPRQHLLSVAGSKEPSWPLGHPRDSQSGACTPLREGYAWGWPGSPAAVLSGRTFTYRDALMLVRVALHGRLPSLFPLSNPQAPYPYPLAPTSKARATPLNVETPKSHLFSKRNLSHVNR